MILNLDWKIIKAICSRTFKQSIESPIAYVVGLLFYGFVGTLFALNFFDENQASIYSIGVISPWILWFVVPALTMNLISDEIQSGTFEQLSTLPVRDWEIVLGKYLGFALLGLGLIGGLVFYPIVLMGLVDHPLGLDWGRTSGILIGLYFLVLLYGSMGLWASSLAKNQVVVLILGMIFCTLFFFLGQFFSFLPGFLRGPADFLGVMSHLNTLNRGVIDFRDIFYFLSLIFIFLYFTVQRLSARRF